MQELLSRGRSELLAAMSPVPSVVGRGERLVRSGEEHEFIYLVESGWMARSRTTGDGRQQIIVTFLPGELCGIKCVFMDRQPDDISALTSGSVRRIHFSEVQRLAAVDFAVAMELAWQLAVDERHLHNWVVRLGRASADERLAALLLELRNRLIRLGANAHDGYLLPLTQHQIADHVGLTPVHVSRVLRRFREEDMVVVHRGEVRFLSDVAALERLAAPVQDLLGE